MVAPNAKLEIAVNNSHIQEFLINSDLVSIGRSSDNTLRLDRPDISRHHACIAFDSSGYVITDLGSSTGTRVNDIELQPRIYKLLNHGDLIRIGAFELKFLTGSVAVRAASRESTEVAKPLSSVNTVLENIPRIPRLQVITPHWTKEFLLERETIHLGRTLENDIVIDLPVVSSKHARLTRKEDSYEIVDLDSKNGLTLEGHRIEKKILSDGDVLYIDANVALAYQTAVSTATIATVKVLNLSDRDRWSLGRDPQNDTAIDHPSVSRFHASIERKDGSLVIADLNSTNGTFVNGKQVKGHCVLKPGDTIRIGPCRFVFNADGTVISHNETGNLRLDAINLTKVVGKGTNLLSDVSLSVLPKEFVAIVGVSGGGKTTLLDALNGFRPATGGTVLVNGNDLYKNFNAYRTEFGYVPQDDIIHKELTVKQALDYAAQLRMPADTTAAERHKRVQEVLADLELTQRQDVPVKSLSGGQRKRVSIGVELITKPSLFFLDEATSGLDPGTEAQIMRLLRKLADRGRTILLITHATKNVMLCDLVVFLTRGGRVAYLGSPEQAPAYFGVQEFDEIYDKVENELSSEAWQERYKQSPQFQKYVLERQQNLEIPKQTEAKHARRKQQLPAYQVKQVSAWKQFLILSQRNLAILVRDRASLFLMLAIAPILGGLDILTWKKTIFDIEQGDAGHAILSLFIISLISVMVGSLATMREIVKEAEIYRRERTIGLKVVPYILSKVWIGVLIALYQAAVFLILKVSTINFPSGVDWTVAYITLVLATIAGMVMGLLVSGISPNQNVAPLLTLVFLVPQITFGGGVLPVRYFENTPGQYINQATITKWPFEALVTIVGMGLDVAEDPCWQIPDAERKKLTPANIQEKGCKCLGPNIFRQCKFPGIKSTKSYDPADLDAPEPTRPKEPELDPTDLNGFKQKRQEFNKAIDKWQKDYSEWKGKYEAASKGSEGLIQRFYERFGTAYKVDVMQHWGSLGLLILAMLGLLLVVQKRKDIV